MIGRSSPMRGQMSADIRRQIGTAAPERLIGQSQEADGDAGLGCAVGTGRRVGAGCVSWFRCGLLHPRGRWIRFLGSQFILLMRHPHFGPLAAPFSLLTVEPERPPRTAFTTLIVATPQASTCNTGKRPS